MNDVKKGKKSALDYSKLKLGIKVLQSNDPATVYYSDIIEDSKYFDLKIEEIHHNEDSIRVSFKSGNGKLIKSMISKISLKTTPDQEVLSNSVKNMSEKQVEFENVEKGFDPESKKNILVEIEYKDKSIKCFEKDIKAVKNLKRNITDVSNNPDEPKKMKMDCGNSLESEEGM